MIIEQCTDSGIWDAFIETSPQYNIFCTKKFLDAIPRWNEMYLVWSGQEILAGFVISKNEAGELSPNLFPYQGILIGRHLMNLTTHRRIKKINEAVSQVIHFLSRKYKNFSFSLHYTFEDIRPFLWHNHDKPIQGQFSISPCYSAIINLSQYDCIEQYLKNIRTSRRQEYFAHRTRGFTIDESTDVGLLDHLHDLTFRRQGITRSQMERAMATDFARTALEENFGSLLVSRDPTGRAVSANLFIHDKDCSYYFLGANDPQFRGSGAGTALLIEQIHRSMLAGKKNVDMVGVNSPNRGDYKTSFNAEIVMYFTTATGQKGNV